MVEAKVWKIMEGFVNSALMIKHKVKLEEQSMESCEFFVIKCLSQLFNVINLRDWFTVKTSWFNFPVVVFVESSEPTLDPSSLLLHPEVNFPLFFQGHKILFSNGSRINIVFISWVSIEPRISFSLSVVVSPDVFILIDFNIIIFVVPLILLSFDLSQAKECENCELRFHIDILN